MKICTFNQCSSHFFGFLLTYSFLVLIVFKWSFNPLTEDLTLSEDLETKFEYWAARVTLKLSYFSTFIGIASGNLRRKKCRSVTRFLIGLASGHGLVHWDRPDFVRWRRKIEIKFAENLVFQGIWVVASKNVIKIQMRIDVVPGSPDLFHRWAASVICLWLAKDHRPSLRLLISWFLWKFFTEIYEKLAEA